MKVRETDCAENIAFGKTATQSSTYSARHASFAIDGRIVTSIAQSTCTVAGYKPKTHWWKVDFGSLNVIVGVEMHMGMAPTSTGYNVQFSKTTDDFQAYQLCYKFPSKEHFKLVKQEFKCIRENVVARFLKVEVKSTQALRLYEVIVLGWDAGM